MPRPIPTLHVDLYGVVRDNVHREVIDCRKAEALVDAETTAYVARWQTHGEDTWLGYAYAVDGVEYGFMWTTPYDETHRVYAHDRRRWYDALEKGSSFPVQYVRANPKLHKAPSMTFVVFLGAFRKKSVDGVSRWVAVDSGVLPE